MWGSISHDVLYSQFLGKHMNEIMNTVEFKPFGKIPRENPLLVTITEKIDGTNACIVIKDGEVVGVQSRKRFITPDSDNFGFASWVNEHKAALLALGDGYHYGEWAGPGIQKNPRNLKDRRFFLFNVFKWGEHNPPPVGCEVVSVLFNGELSKDTLEDIMISLYDRAIEYEGYTPEGIVIYHHASRSYSKHTFKNTKGK